MVPSPTRRAVLSAPFLLTARGKAAPRARIHSVRAISHQPAYYPAWATLAQRRSGELVVSYSGGREGHVCPFGRVEMMRSFDQGETWSWPQVLMDTPIDDRDSGIVETARGSLLATTFTSVAFEKVFQEAKGWDADRVDRWKAVYRSTTAEQRKSLLGAWMVRSTDNGHLWSQPYRVPMMSPHGPILLRNGHLLYAGLEYPGPPRRVGAWTSTDDGLTWKLLGEIPTRPGDDSEHYHELHAVETASGKLIAQIRNHNKTNERETLQSESSDGGKTWSTPRAIGVWGLPSHLIRLRDGRLLMSYGYRRPPRGNHARISEDEGRNWSEPIVLSDDGTGDLGYPSTVQLPSGEMLTVWYEARRSGSTAVKLPDPPLSVLRQARWSLEG